MRLPPYWQELVNTVLIETYWNVNTQTGLLYHPVPVCINRNILECKYSFCVLQIIIPFGINRNILECKLLPRSRWQILTEGINRNILECKYTFSILSVCSFMVLIETYWNVNQVEKEYIGEDGLRINRNILECK